MLCTGIVILLSVCIIGASVVLKRSGESGENGEIREGEQPYVLEEFAIDKDGLSELVFRLEPPEGYPDKIMVSDFWIQLTEEGRVQDFRIALEGFDAYGEYVGDYVYTYSEEGHELIFENFKEASFPTYYNKNFELSYLDAQIRRIPVAAQMKLLDFTGYYLEFQKYSQILAGSAIMDGRAGQDFPLLSYEEYKQGIGGMSDGSTALAVALSEGEGTTGMRIDYCCQTADGEGISGNPEQVMQTDYRINNGDLCLTDDAGETWVSAGLTKEQVESTLELYGQGNSIPEDSFYADGNGFFALIYRGGIQISRDGGASWADYDFPYSDLRPATRNLVGFLDAQTGYGAIGTEWSMGTGVDTRTFWTHDGGATWEERAALPVDGYMLTGIVFADEQNGVVTQERDDAWPMVQVTADGGTTYQENPVSWDDIPMEVGFLNKVDSIVFQDGIYTIVMGQGSYGNKKVVFTSGNLAGEWVYEKYYIGTVHTEG